MRKVFVIGIGAGNPDYITVQAINALNEVDVFFVMDKGQEKEHLVRLRPRHDLHHRSWAWRSRRGRECVP